VWRGSGGRRPSGRAIPSLIFISEASAGRPSEGEVKEVVKGGGIIDWSGQVVRATGIGAANPALPLAAQRPNAIRVARNDALRKILETVKGISITSETRIENAMMVSDEIVTKLDRAIAKNFREVGEPRYYDDGTVEVDVEMAITGELMDMFLPKTGGGSYTVSGRAPAQKYTGLVVDARGLGAQPAMAPKILDEDGNEVYGTGFVDRGYAVKVGISGYARTLRGAMEDPRVAGNPLVVRGIRAIGANKADIVISNSDAKEVHLAARAADFLKECRVMIVVGEKER